MVTQSIIIGLWGYLFCNVLTKKEQLLNFAAKPLKALPWPLNHAIIGCAKCHAGWLSIGFLLEWELIFFAMASAVGLAGLVLYFESYFRILKILSNHDWEQLFFFVVPAMFVAHYLDQKV